MTISALAAARHLCRKSDWTLTNLRLQKILYIAHMVHSGRYDEPLVSGRWSASVFGPIHTGLWRECRIFGGRPIMNIFHRASEIEGQLYRASLNEAWDALVKYSDSQLIAITHAEGGAWNKRYQPEEKDDLYNTMSHEDIVAEYHFKMARLKEKKASEEPAIPREPEAEQSNPWAARR